MPTLFEAFVSFAITRCFSTTFRLNPLVHSLFTVGYGCAQRWIVIELVQQECIRFDDFR